uniref:Retrotransposon gag domain-containing protein n=1 Tax=Nicotiana tabacum TaxID=4097 RepID=A0A1S4D5J8_TOBAC|nr:PREDICTED: uncharacterized protein LOC107826172 [Nicotiana tabacum]
MRRVRSQDRLQGFDPEPERTFHRRLREARDTNNIQALVQFPVDMAEEQPMAVQEVAMPSVANVTSSIVKPRITGHLELKQSMIQLLHANGQFMGLPHEDPKQHILNFLEISDTYITNGVTPDYVRLTLFPFSLLGEAKRWLKAEPANSITTWNDLARKFLARFFPSGKTTKIRSEIVAFKQKAGESLYSAWERFKGLLRDCHHQNQTNEVLAHTFIEGLHSETKIVVDAAAGGQVLEKSFDEIYALLNKFSKSNPDWQAEMGRHTVQKSAGVLELDVVSALSAQIATLTNQVNQMNLSINKPNKSVWGHLQSQLEDHPNFSWGGNQVPQNQYKPQVPQQQYRPPQVEQQVSPTNYLEDMLKKVMDEQQALSKKVMAEQQALATTEVPKYARYLRDIVANKQRHAEFETVALTEECSARVQSELPPTLKDPGSFTIPLSLGKQEVGRALCNLGASINLMSSSLIKQLGLGALRPTTITLQLAARSLVMPEGIIEDVLVRVGKFILPANFIVLDYEADMEVPIILGQLFLATGGAIIDVRAGKLKMRVDDEEVTFNVYKALKLPKHYENLCMITVVESKGIKQSPYVNYSDLDGTTELKEVVFPAERVKMIEKRTRDERGDLPRACKKARFHGRKKKRKRPA